MSGSQQSPLSALRAEIRQFKHPPGQKIPIHRLCESFGLSPIPIREALIRLSGEDLVECRPNKGFFYKNVDGQELVMLYECIFLILSGVIATRAESDSANPLAIPHARHTLAMADEQTDHLKITDAIEATILGIARATCNRYLEKRVANLIDLTHFHRLTDLRTCDDLQSYIQQYRRLIDAVMAGEATRAQSIMSSISRRVHDTMSTVVKEMLYALNRHGSR